MKNENGTIGRRSFCKLAAGALLAPSISHAARLVSRANMNAAFYVAIGDTLTVYRPDTAAQTLAVVGAYKTPEAVQYAWPHPSLPLLYVAYSNRYSTKKDDHHGIAVLKIERSTGRLSPLGTDLPLTNRPVNVTLNSTGKFLLGAYNAPSALTIHPLDASGAVGAAIAQHASIDAGIYAHQVRVAPDDRTVILPTRGNDATSTKPEDPGAIKAFYLDGGQLTGEQSVAPNGGIGFGPRHVDFHPSKPWMFTSMERENQLQVFDYENGHISAQPRFVKSSLADAANVHPQQLVGPIHVSHDGRFVYLANRADGTAKLANHDVFVGGENNIAVFEINQATGEPTLIQNVATDSFHPRTFSIHPDGKMLVSAAIEPMEVREGQTLSRTPAALTIFRISRDGRLSRMSKIDVETGSDWMFWCGMVPLRS